MRSSIRFFTLFLTLGIMLCLLGCQKSTSGMDGAGPVIPADLRVGVVPFSEPRTTSELISGRIPQHQGIAAPDELQQLDILLRSALQNTPRTYTWLAEPLNVQFADHHNSETPQALAHWLQYGQDFKVDLLLVPQIIHWQQREGSRAGVTKAAHVRAEFFLLDIRGQRIFRHSVFEEEQVGLVEDFLQVGTFFKRGAGWITAEEMTQEAIAKALKELSLQ